VLMGNDALIGRIVNLIVADPWDLVGADGSNELECAVSRVVAAPERDLLEVRFARALLYDGRRYDRAVLHARSDESLIDLLLTGEEVEVSLYGVTAGAEPPLADPQTWWRGGAAGIATASLSSGRRPAPS
jgi:hypothetical protein